MKNYSECDKEGCLVFCTGQYCCNHLNGADAEK